MASKTVNIPVLSIYYSVSLYSSPIFISQFTQKKESFRMSLQSCMSVGLEACQQLWLFASG
jgi:hypothetical protein